MAVLVLFFMLIIAMMVLMPQSASRFTLLPELPAHTGCGCSTTFTLLAILVVLLILRFA